MKLTTGERGSEELFFNLMAKIYIPPDSEKK